MAHCGKTNLSFAGCAAASRTFFGYCILISALFLAPVHAADDAETPGLIDKVETEAGELEQTAKEKAEAAAAAARSEAEALASEAVSEGKELGGKALGEAEKLGEEALTTGEAVIKKEAPVVEATAKEVEEKAAELDRKWEPVIQKDVETDAAKVGHAISAEAALARARIAAGSLWLAAYLRNVEKDGKLKISDEILKLNLLSPGLGTHVIDEMRYLKRASQLEIKKGETAVEREGARLLRKSRDDLQAAGHWVRDEVGEGEAKLESAAIKAKRAILAEENKADFWLEGRPLSDIKAEAVIAHHNLLVSNEFPSATLCAECHPGQYRQWSVSQHAYAQLSPVFNAMSERINRITNGTNGDFCIRCHNVAGMSVNEPIFIPNAEPSPRDPGGSQLHRLPSRRERLRPCQRPFRH